MPKGCCVAGCTANSIKNKLLKFHLLPLSGARREKWLRAINRREVRADGSVTLWEPRSNYTYVCSRHFIYEKSNDETDPDYVPSVFPTNFSSSSRSSSSQLASSRTLNGKALRRKAIMKKDEELLETVPQTNCWDHDYCSSSESLDLRSYETKTRLRSQEEAVGKFGLERFAASDDDIRLYTRFASYAHLMSFWSEIESATHNLVRPAPTSLQLIDEFFLFLTYISLGLLESDLALRFGIAESSVGLIISSWAQFLSSLLHCVWLDQDSVRSNLPEAFSLLPEAHVILAWVRLQSEGLSEGLSGFSGGLSGGPSRVLRGMVGLAPYGPVMFVSPLFESAVSDREVLERSGLLPLLTPSMELILDQGLKMDQGLIMAKGFNVDDLLPCKVHSLLELSGAKGRAAHRLRVHVERLVGRVKDHKLFSSQIPSSLSGCLHQLFSATCLLANYHDRPLVTDWAKRWLSGT